MSERKGEYVLLEKAKEAVASASRRVALLHLAYAKVLVDELGEERALKIILKAIKYYGMKIGEKTREEVVRQGLEPLPENFSAGKSYRLPEFGMHDKIEVVTVNGEKRIRAYGCVLGKVWKEYGEEELGRLYCYMDIAKYMGYNPNYKFIHTKCILEGDEYCELVVRPTTEKERKIFFSKDEDWRCLDKY